MRNELEKLLSAPRDVQSLALLIFLVGIHSMGLGIFIYFFTELFYQFFFHSKLDNIFFVRQSGLFLVCLAMFYFSPLPDLKRRHRLVFVIILTKVLAVLFLVTNSSHAPWPPIILLAAAGDGCMALLLTYLYRTALPRLEENAAAAWSD